MSSKDKNTEKRGDVLLYEAVNKKLCEMAKQVEAMAADVNNEDFMATILKISTELKKISDNLNHFRINPIQKHLEEKPVLGPEQIVLGK